MGNKLGWSSLETSLDVLFGSCDTGNSVEACGNFLCSLVGKIHSEEHKAMCKKLACTYMEALSREDDDQSSTGRKPAFLIRLIRCTVLLDFQAELSTLVASVIKRPHIYPVQETLAPTLKQLKRSIVMNSDSLQRLVLHCISSLEVSMKRFTQPPSLSAPNATIKCSCTECKKLIAFLKNPRQRQHRFRTVGGQPGHLEEKVVALCLDYTSTYSYVSVTKSQANYVSRNSAVQATYACIKDLLKTAGTNDQGESSVSALEPALKRKKLNEVCIDLT